MGTRGLYGFIKNGERKITYNHFDSYPDGLGESIVDFIKKTSIEEMKKIFDKIKLVDNKIQPTPEEKEKCIKWTDLGVSHQSENDWYCLLRKSQGDLDSYKDGLEYMLDYSDPDIDADQEYIYIIDLDKNILKFTDCYTKKIKEFSLTKLPKNIIKQMVDE